MTGIIRTTVKCIHFSKTEAYFVNGSRFGIYHFGEVDGVVFPFIVGFPDAGLQGDFFVMDVFAHTVERPAGITECVLLQELMHIVAVDFENDHIYGRQVDGFKRNNPFFFTGKNVSLSQKTQLRRNHGKCRFDFVIV